MNLKTQLFWCIFCSSLLTLLALGLTIFFADSNWFSFGPSKNLIVAGVIIDTYYKYVVLVLIVVLNSSIDMIIKEFADPILGFNVYNPDKKVITDFQSKRQLQILANSYWAVSNFRNIFTVLISISQFDLALIKWFSLELTAIYTINTLLKKKRFLTEKEEEIELI